MLKREKLETSCDEKLAKLEIVNDTHVSFKVFEDLISPKVFFYLHWGFDSLLLGTYLQLEFILDTLRENLEAGGAYKIDPCDVMKAKRKNKVLAWIIGVMVPGFKKQTWKCPVKKGDYMITEISPMAIISNLTLMQTKYVSFPEFQKGLVLTVELVLSATVNKKRETFCSMKLHSRNTKEGKSFNITSEDSPYKDAIALGYILPKGVEAS